jgi:hypothetical protein
MSYRPLKVNRRFGGACRLHLQGLRSKQEMSVNKVASKQASYIPEDRTIHNHSCENINFYEL